MQLCSSERQVDAALFIRETDRCDRIGFIREREVDAAVFIERRVIVA
jgi:hypothetical protein